MTLTFLARARGWMGAHRHALLVLGLAIVVVVGGTLWCAPAPTPAPAALLVTTDSLRATLASADSARQANGQEARRNLALAAQSERGRHAALQAASQSQRRADSLEAIVAALPKATVEDSAAMVPPLVVALAVRDSENVALRVVITNDSGVIQAQQGAMLALAADTTGFAKRVAAYQANAEQWHQAFSKAAQCKVLFGKWLNCPSRLQAAGAGAAIVLLGKLIVKG